MPIYQYHCQVCGVDFEVRQSFSDTTKPLCPNGHANVVRVLTPPSIVFKGSGWYITDHKPKQRGNGHTARSQESAHSDGSSTPAKEESSAGKTSAVTKDASSPHHK